MIYGPYNYGLISKSSRADLSERILITEDLKMLISFVFQLHYSAILLSDHKPQVAIPQGIAIFSPRNSFGKFQKNIINACLSGCVSYS